MQREKQEVRDDRRIQYEKKSKKAEKEE
jgi:hypothetical protein